MKNVRILLSLVILILAFSTGSVLGAPASLPISLDESIEDPNDLTSRDNILKTGTQAVYAPVTIIQETITGESTSIIAPQVLRITYRYYIHEDTDGDYTGGYMINNSEYPKLTVSAPSYLNVSFSKVNGPTFTKVNGPTRFTFVGGNPYTITISGGAFSITYNSTVRYNVRGDIISVTPTTVTRSYYYTATGP